MSKKFYVPVFAIVALVSIALAQPAGSPVDRYGALKVVGNRIVSSKTGNPVALRGMSFTWNNPTWETGNEGNGAYYTTGVTEWLASDWKVDIVRVAIDPNHTDKENWKTVVAAAKAKGIYVIIDFHAHDKGLSESAKTFFSGLSSNATYKNVPNILYEIFNEPCPTTRTQTGGGGCQGDDWASDIKPYADKVVKAIRDNGDTSIIIIGTPNFSKRVDQAAAAPVTVDGGRNLAYALHYYTGHVATASDPTGANSEHRARLRAWAGQALALNKAIFVSEFGISQPGGGKGDGEDNSVDKEEAQRWFDFLDENQIGWANWCISHKGEAAAALNGSASTSGGWSSNDLSVSGSYIRGKLLYYATPITLTTSATGAGEGTVSVSPASPYYPAQQVTLTAEPKSGSRFEGWEGDISGNLAERVSTVALKGSTSIKGVFFPENLISNSTFTANADPWQKRPASGNLSPETDVKDGEFVIAMGTSLGAEAASVRVQHPNTSLTQGRRYKLTFDARAAKARTIRTAYRTGDAGSGHKFLIGDAVELKTTKGNYEREFNMTAATTTAGFIAFYLGGQEGGVTIDNVKLDDIGELDPSKPNPDGSTEPDPPDSGETSVSQRLRSAGHAAWSVSRAGGGLQLRGPAEAGVKVSFYDVRGKLVRSMAAVDGLALGAGIPAGNYIVVVKNRAGGELLRTRVVMVR